MNMWDVINEAINKFNCYLNSIKSSYSLDNDINHYSSNYQLYKADSEG